MIERMFEVKDREADSLDGGGDPVLRMRMALAELAGEDRDGWTGGALSGLVVEMIEVRERLDAELLRLVGAWDRNRAWELDGSLSPRAWLEHRTPVGPGEAHRFVKAARLIDAHRSIDESLADGAISVPHVEAMAKVLSKDRRALLSDHEEMLVQQAEKLGVSEFTTVMRRWASLADDQLATDAFAEKYDRRHLHASHTLDGWLAGDFYLDPAAGATLLQVLDHLGPPDPADAPDGPRTLSQRRADALVDLAGWYHRGGRPGGDPPQVNVIVDVATLTGNTPGMAAARCDLEGAGPVARSVLDQLACDAEFTRFLMSSPSVVLDMGRSTRLATTAQRRAVTIRDGHCRFPSCRRLPQWCDVHHVAGWAAHLGDTDLANLVLLCRRHHTLIHNTRWTIRRTEDGEYEFTHPARGP